MSYKKNYSFISSLHIHLQTLYIYYDTHITLFSPIFYFILMINLINYDMVLSIIIIGIISYVKWNKIIVVKYLYMK